MHHYYTLQFDGISVALCWNGCNLLRRCYSVVLVSPAGREGSRMDMAVVSLSDGYFAKNAGNTWRFTFYGKRCCNTLQTFNKMLTWIPCNDDYLHLNVTLTVWYFCHLPFWNQTGGSLEFKEMLMLWLKVETQTKDFCLLQNCSSQSVTLCFRFRFLLLCLFYQQFSNISFLK